MESKSTEQLVHDHTDLVNLLERKYCLYNEISYIRIPFRAFESDVFFERKDSGKRRLTNSVGQTMPSDHVKIERTMLITSTRSDSGKKTIRVDTRSQRPNIVFFTDVGEQIDFHTQQLIGYIAFYLWHMTQNKYMTDRDLSCVLRRLSAVVLHHINKQSQPEVARFFLYTDMDEAQYLAPFASLRDHPSKYQLIDMKFVLDHHDLPEHVQPLSAEELIGLKRSTKPYSSKALQDIKRAMHHANESDKQSVDGVASLIEHHFKTNPHQAVDLYDIVMNEKDERELIEELSNNVLLQTAGPDQAPTMTADEKRRVLRVDFVEKLINRC